MLSRLALSTPIRAQPAWRCVSSIAQQGRQPVLTHDEAGVFDMQRSFSSAFPMAGAVTPATRSSPAFALPLYVQSAKKATARRDPDRPKRPMSAFMLFAQDQRGKGIKDLKAISASWKSSSTGVKEPFEREAAVSKETYTKAFAAYKDSGKLAAWSRDPARPKRPMTPYMSWAVQARNNPKFANLKIGDAAKQLGAEWKTLPAHEKSSMEATYKREMETYNAAMKQYKESGAEKAWLDKTGRLDGAKKAEAKKEAEKAKLLAQREKKKAQLAKRKEQKAAQAAKLKERNALKKAKARELVERKKKAAADAKAKKKAAAEKKQASAKALAAKKKAARQAAAQKKKAAAEKKKVEAKAAAEKKKAAATKRAAALKEKARKLREAKLAKAKKLREAKLAKANKLAEAKKVQAAKQKAAAAETQRKEKALAAKKAAALQARRQKEKEKAAKLRAAAKAKAKQALRK